MVRSLLRIKRICGALVALLLSGCAAMFNGGPQQVALHSTTGQSVGVRVQVPNGSEYGATLPTVVHTLPHSFKNFAVIVDDPCFEPMLHVVNKTVQPTYFLNLLNIHGLYIDYFSGYMWRYDPNVVVPTKPRSANAEDCATKPLPVAVVNEPKPLPPLPDSPTRQRHELGAGAVPLRIHTNDEKDGFYIYYNFQPTDLYRFQFRLLGNSNYDSDYENLGSNYSYTDYNYDWSLVSAAVQITPFPNQGVYLGAGVGAAVMHVSYYKFGRYESSTWVDLEETSYPFFFELGWKTRARLNINLFANVSLQTLGLSPPAMNIDAAKLARIADVNARNKVARLFKNGAEYSAVGIGLGWSF